MIRFQQALKGAFLKISTCGLLQIVGTEKVFFSYMIHEDTKKMWKYERIEQKVVKTGSIQFCKKKLHIFATLIFKLLVIICFVSTLEIEFVTIDFIAIQRGLELLKSILFDGIITYFSNNLYFHVFLDISMYHIFSISTICNKPHVDILTLRCPTLFNTLRCPRGGS